MLVKANYGEESKLFLKCSMNLFSSIVCFVHKRTTVSREFRNRSKPAVMLSSERLEPRHYLSANGLVQDPGESWSVTYDGLTDGSQRPYFIGNGYSSSNLNQADVAMLADVVRARYDVTGKGIKIGIISDSFNAEGGMADDIALGVLPNMNGTDSRGKQYIVRDINYGEDEGRGMAQLVHAIAPGAELYFASPFAESKEPDEIIPSKVLDQAEAWAMGMDTQIKRLVNDLNVDIIVDDLYHPFVPWFQDGTAAQAVDWAVGKGVAYFSAAANQSNVGYQSYFRGTGYSEISHQLPSNAPENTEHYLYHDFNPLAGHVDIMQEVKFEPAYTNKTTFIVQWDQPWGYNNSANEVWFFDSNQQYLGKTHSDSSYPIAAYPLLIDTGPETPAERLKVTSTFYVAFVHNTHGHDGGGQESPTFFNWLTPFNGGQPPVSDNLSAYSFIEYAEHGSSTVWGHNNSKLAANVGAAQYWSTPAYHSNASVGESVLSEFSSFGGTPIIFDHDGQRKQAFEYRPQPRFIAPQNGDTSFFGNNDPDKDQLPNFSGTSAAAPNVAAVAALMLELNQHLAPAEIYEHLAAAAVNLTFSEQPAIPSPTLPPVGTPDHFNYPTGVGLIQAKDAVDRAAGISIQGKVFEDFGRNGIQNRGDRLLAGVPVFLDSNGNGIRDSEPPIKKDGQPLTVLPALNYQSSQKSLLWPTKAGSVIRFEDMAGTITDVALSYTIHAPEGVDPSGPNYVRPFLTLISPLGIRVPVTGTKLQGNSFDSWGSFSDQESTTRFGSKQTISMEASLAENTSLADLTAFKDTPANGSWSLEVMNANRDHSYTLDSWSLTLTTEEPQVETDAQGEYEFSGSLLSFSAAVGAYAPMVELPDNQFITTNNKTAIGSNNLKPIVNIGISLPRVERPQLLRSRKILVDNSVPGPHPFVFSWNNLATSLLPSVSGVRFIISSIRGTVEKKSGDAWIDVSTPPQTSNPRELIRLLSLRIIKPNDELRWIPPAESPQTDEAFSLFGWNGTSASKSKSTIRFEML